MDPGHQEIMSDDDRSLPNNSQNFWDIPPPLEEAIPNNEVHLDQERMFENDKMHTDRGNGCFSNKKF